MELTVPRSGPVAGWCAGPAEEVAADDACSARIGTASQPIAQARGSERCVEPGSGSMSTAATHHPLWPLLHVHVQSGNLPARSQQQMGLSCTTLPGRADLVQAPSEDSAESAQGVSCAPWDVTEAVRRDGRVSLRVSRVVPVYYDAEVALWPAEEW